MPKREKAKKENKSKDGKKKKKKQESKSLVFPTLEVSVRGKSQLRFPQYERAPLGEGEKRKVTPLRRPLLSFVESVKHSWISSPLINPLLPDPFPLPFSLCNNEGQLSLSFDAAASETVEKYVAVVAIRPTYQMLSHVRWLSAPPPLNFLLSSKVIAFSPSPATSISPPQCWNSRKKEKGNPNFEDVIALTVVVHCILPERSVEADLFSDLTRMNSEEPCHCREGTNVPRESKKRWKHFLSYACSFALLLALAVQP